MSTEKKSGAPWVITVTAGEDLGLQHSLVRSETSIGRGAGQDLLLNDVAASRRHAIVTGEGDSFRVTDLGAANGVTVNGTRVTSVLLHEGDEIRIGNTVMRFGRAPWWEESVAPAPLRPNDPVLPRRA